MNSNYLLALFFSIILYGFKSFGSAPSTIDEQITKFHSAIKNAFSRVTDNLLDDVTKQEFIEANKQLTQIIPQVPQSISWYHFNTKLLNPFIVSFKGFRESQTPIVCEPPLLEAQKNRLQFMLAQSPFYSIIEVLYNKIETQKANTS